MLVQPALGDQPGAVKTSGREESKAKHATAGNGGWRTPS